jgi:ATP phosphoribosyltransferase regulatory subunit
MASNELRRQRPLGLNDLFGAQAAAYAALERDLIEQFERWGYGRVVLPTIGYDETLSTQASQQMREQLYRFFDRDGRALALRPDMTVPVARLVGTTLYDQPLPLRLFYAGQVFRYAQPQAGQRREFTQMGIELVGAASPEADAEVIAVAMEALRTLGVETFQINLGQVDFIKGILNGMALSAEALFELEQAINRKSSVEIERVLRQLEIGGEAAEAIQALPGLCGDVSIIGRARQLTISPSAHRALDHLARVYELLALDGYSEHLILDLGEVRSMDYYTGISFHGYVAGLGFHVLSGGRYDRLIGHFGPDRPAVGFAMSIERSLLVARPSTPRGPDLVVPACQHPACRRLAALARSRGLRVVVELGGRSGQALIDAAQAYGAARIVSSCDGERCWLVEGEQMREVTLTALLEEATTWSR